MLKKRWWLIALVFTLALSLTSCSKRLPQDLQSGPVYGFGYCDGSMGAFDVYVIPSQTDSSTYQLAIIPVSLDQPGDIVRIDLANSSPSYKSEVSELVLQPNQEINAGYLTDSDLQSYNILSITPYDGSGATYLEQAGEKDAICNLPLPGDGMPTSNGTPTTQARSRIRPFGIR